MQRDAPTSRSKGVDSSSLTRDERRLVDVRSKIRALSVVSTDRLNLPERYRALVALEAILVQRVDSR